MNESPTNRQPADHAHGDPTMILAREVARLADLLELFFWRQGGPQLADMRASQAAEAAGEVGGRAFVPTMTDEELADQEWRELHSRQQQPEPGEPGDQTT